MDENPRGIIRQMSFHRVDPATLSSDQEFVDWLAALVYNPCMIYDDGDETVVAETRQRVDRIGGLSIEVYPNEHPPPHFHVRAAELDASFTIKDCDLLHGECAGSDLRKIKHWHRHAKPLLVRAWDSSRPTQCVATLRGA